MPEDYASSRVALGPRPVQESSSCWQVAIRGMASSMATTKVTITLEDEQLAAIRQLVASGDADSVSAFVQHAVGVSLADVAGWGSMLGQALEQTGGPLTAKERAWADSVLKGGARKKGKRKAA